MATKRKPSATHTPLPTPTHTSGLFPALEIFSLRQKRKTNKAPGARGQEPGAKLKTQDYADWTDYPRAAINDVVRIARWTWHQLKLKHVWRAIGLGILAIGAASVALLGLLYSTTFVLYGKDIQNPAVLLKNKNTGITITDRNDKPLYEASGNVGHVVMEYNEIPASMIQATLAAEDPEFYNHAGVSWRGISRALYKNATAGSTVEGGSTLTQQLIKNTVLQPTRSVLRKAQEVILSTELERRYTKQQIMGMYLNAIYYGEDSYGIEEASQHYFGKSARNLTLGESALLAGLPLGPSRFDPVANRDAALSRRNYILDRMAHSGFITTKQAAAAKKETPVIAVKNRSILAPHFVFYVLNKLRATYGDDVVDHGGITVKTTLDIDKQNAAQDIVSAQIARLADRNVTNGALISTLPTTGDITAMVGSVNYYEPNFGSVNVTLSQRQPGSSFKPIVYLAAFQKGWNDGTQVDDAPLSLPDGNGGQYVPQNYDGKFRGKVTLRRALANSLNIPAVKVMQFVGLQTALDQAHTLGITTLNQPERYGLSLVLGGGEVRMIDMAAVYGTFARGGIKSQPRAILNVRDRYGRDITAEKPATDVRVADAKAVAMLTSILSDNATRSEIFGANSPLATPRPTAVKTGTTNDFRDNWTAGFTSDVTTIVWVGNNNNAPMGNGVDGITGAAPIWRSYMDYVFAKQ